MPVSFISETELPGRVINLDTLKIIAHRYYWVSQYVSGKKVLEVGCGPALGLGYLSKISAIYVGGDITRASLQQARDYYGTRSKLVGMDAHHLPFKDKSFDVIVCVAAVIYLELPLFLNECRRLLQPDGQLLINTPNKHIPDFQPSVLSRRYYSVPELSSLFSNHGFHADFFGAFIVPAPIRRRLQKLVSSLMSLGTKCLSGLHLDTGIKKFLMKKKVNVVLKNEIDKTDILLTQDIPIVPVPSSKLDKEHRIIYVLARLGQDNHK
ncbi:MAG: class I SAM-dependent methyltransferase [Candidatus Omnitrophica bacterium]|nr:class I SAM-dependent methyltransferase [Candidatus Omnitrophota bacterium]